MMSFSNSRNKWWKKDWRTVNPIVTQLTNQQNQLISKQNNEFSLYFNLGALSLIHFKRVNFGNNIRLH